MSPAIFVFPFMFFEFFSSLILIFIHPMKYTSIMIWIKKAYGMLKEWVGILTVTSDKACVEMPLHMLRSR